MNRWLHELRSALKIPSLDSVDPEQTLLNLLQLVPEMDAQHQRLQLVSLLVLLKVADLIVIKLGSPTGIKSAGSRYPCSFAQCSKCLM